MSKKKELLDAGNRGGNMSPRVAARPDPTLWGEDELMTLTEAADLFWPSGPLTVRSLRTAVRDGVLPIADVAGKYLTSRRAIQEMSRCAPKTATVRKDSRRSPPPATGRRPDPPEAFDRLMRKIGRDADDGED